MKVEISNYRLERRARIERDNGDFFLIVQTTHYNRAGENVVRPLIIYPASTAVDWQSVQTYEQALAKTKEIATAWSEDVGQPWEIVRKKPFQSVPSSLLKVPVAYVTITSESRQASIEVETSCYVVVAQDTADKVLTEPYLLLPVGPIVPTNQTAFAAALNHGLRILSLWAASVGCPASVMGAPGPATIGGDLSGE